jgi:hypothetical protein
VHEHSDSGRKDSSRRNPARVRRHGDPGSRLVRPGLGDAAIRREPGKRGVEFHAFVVHDPAAAAGLPEPFRTDHDERYDPGAALDADELAEWFAPVTAPIGRHKPVLLGAVPAFDAIRLQVQFGFDPWHYRWICVETMAWTVLQLTTPAAPMLLPGAGDPLGIPWSSDAVTAAIGVPRVPDAERHTAMGDARWARDTFDVAMAHRPGLVDDMLTGCVGTGAAPLAGVTR